MAIDSQKIASDVAARLDRLPLSWFSVKLLIILAPAWAVEAYDIGIIGPTIAVIKPLWAPTASQVALLAVASTVAIAIGLIPSGMLADRFGRRKVLLYGVVWFSVFTGLAGFSPNIGTLTALRFLAGLGLGAVFPLPYIYLAEFLAPAARAQFVGYLNGVLTANYLIPPLAALLLMAHYPHDIAWRYLYLLAFIPVGYALILWFVLPESPRWLANHGRADEALALVKRMEDETTRTRRAPLPPPVRTATVSTTLRMRRTDIFRPPFLRRTIVVSLAYFGSLPVFYVLVTYAPTLMVAQGFKLTNSLLFVAILQLAGGIGGVVQGLLGDRLGRRPAIIGYAALACIGLMGLAYGNSVAMVFIAGLAVGFFGLGIYPAVKTYIAEQYPTPIRGFGSASAESFARFFGGVVFVYAVPFIAAQGGTQLVTVIVAGLLFLTTLVPVALFGVETRGKDIDAVVEEGETVLAPVV